MHHQHHFVPREANPQAQTVTVQSIKYVTPGASAPSSTAPVPYVPTTTPEPTVTRRVGKPITGTSAPTTHSHVYPPVRHQRPDNAQSSHTVGRTKGSPLTAHHTHHAPSGTLNHHNGHSPHKTDNPSPGPNSNGNTPFLSQESNQPKPNLSTSDGGMSGAAKAGIAIGLIILFAFIGGLIFLVYRRKKGQNDAHQPLDDEKSDLHKSNGSVSSHVSVHRNVANAPRLSLRPVTEMFPTMSEKQDNTSASTLIANSAAAARAKTPEGGRNTQSNAGEASDPFSDDAATPNNGDYGAVTAPAAAVPKPLSIKSERTGTGISDRSTATETPGSAPGPASTTGARRLSPPGPGPNNVHRVQLDFNPSMDDELGLRAGQLVRMLHEYDDGWALCIRLDRSQQGVVPRTCISKLPVKPRPQGPPPSARGPAQGRPRGGSNAHGPRASPNDARQRPAGPPNGRVRSQSNAAHQPRPQSPGSFNGPAQARPRATSDAVSGRRITPPAGNPPSPNSTSPTQGNAALNRKPVPGQAL